MREYEAPPFIRTKLSELEDSRLLARSRHQRVTDDLDRAMRELGVLQSRLGQSADPDPNRNSLRQQVEEQRRAVEELREAQRSAGEAAGAADTVLGNCVAFLRDLPAGASLEPVPAPDLELAEARDRVDRARTALSAARLAPAPAEELRLAAEDYVASRAREAGVEATLLIDGTLRVSAYKSDTLTLLCAACPDQMVDLLARTAHLSQVGRVGQPLPMADRRRRIAGLEVELDLNERAEERALQAAARAASPGAAPDRRATNPQHILGIRVVQATSLPSVAQVTPGGAGRAAPETASPARGKGSLASRVLAAGRAS